MTNPCKIYENEKVFEIATKNGRELTYHFPKMLNYLQFKGQHAFGNDFKLYPEDRALLFKLCNYIIGDREACKKMKVDPDKGLLLIGPVGAGKTSLMKLLRHLLPHQKPYQVIPCRNIVFSFNHIGYKCIEDYGDSGYFCFDDLGVEPIGRFYGKDCNVMGEILLSRYEIFQNLGIKCHITTNLNAAELEERYGHRVRSRMRSMFNLIHFDRNTEDKRT